MFDNLEESKISEAIEQPGDTLTSISSKTGAIAHLMVNPSIIRRVTICVKIDSFLY